MTSNVLVTIRGNQFDGAENDTIETIQPGTYRHLEDKHVIFYEEVLEESLNQEPRTNKCILKLGKDFLSISKKGIADTELLFQPGKAHTALYATPMGTFDLSISTQKLQCQEDKESLYVSLQYSLAANGSHISNCQIQISVDFL